MFNNNLFSFLLLLKLHSMYHTVLAMTVTLFSFELPQDESALISITATSMSLCTLNVGCSHSNKQQTKVVIVMCLS